VISSASVRFFRSLTQNAEHSKLTNPHFLTPSVTVEVKEGSYSYLVEIDADGVCRLIDRRQVTTFSILRTSKSHARPSSIYMKPYIRMIAHWDKQTPLDQESATNLQDLLASAISSILSIAPLDVVPTVATGAEI
jgi:hypothetical protein